MKQRIAATALGSIALLCALSSTAQTEPSANVKTYTGDWSPDCIRKGAINLNIESDRVTINHDQVQSTAGHPVDAKPAPGHKAAMKAKLKGIGELLLVVDVDKDGSSYLELAGSPKVREAVGADLFGQRFWSCGEKYSTGGSGSTSRGLTLRSAPPGDRAAPKN